MTRHPPRLRGGRTVFRSVLDARQILRATDGQWPSRSMPEMGWTKGPAPVEGMRAP